MTQLKSTKVVECVIIDITLGTHGALLIPSPCYFKPNPIITLLDSDTRIPPISIRKENNSKFPLSFFSFSLFSFRLIPMNN